MRRLSPVLDDPAPDIDHAPGIQRRVRVLFPPEASAFVAIVQVPAKASVDESLQAAKRLACIGVAEIVSPSPYHRIHLFNKLLGRDRRSTLGEELNLPSDVALRRLAGKDVDVHLATFGRTPLHELKPDEVEPFGQLRDPSLVAIDR